MARKKKWDREADKEFKSMSREWQEDWADLRKRVMGR
jgi:hypothetical protein